MKPSTKIIGFTIIGAVTGALLGLLYGYLVGDSLILFLFGCSIPWMITGALVFLEISSIKEFTKKKSKLVKCLSLIFAIILTFIIIIKIVPFLSIYFETMYDKLFIAPKLH